MATVLLLLFAILGDGTRATRLGNSSLWCRVPCTTLGNSSTLVSQSEERGDSFHVLRGQLLQHLFITHPLVESGDNGSIRNTRYSSSYLGEAGDERPESFPGFLPHCMEVSLHAMLLISAGEVHCEPRTELFPGVDPSWGEVHEPGPGRPRQGYMEICCHYSSVSTCYCWGLVLKCYELRTRQHKMLNVNILRPSKHYFPKDIMIFGRRL
jgi:hypothetical protein